MQKAMRTAVWALFIIYCAVMLWLLFGQRIGRSVPGEYLLQLQWNLNLIPFKTLREYTAVMKNSGSSYMLRNAFINLAGNVVMFIPLGVFLPLLRPGFRNMGRFLLCITAVIIAVELIQLFTLLGSCDIDDLILNVLGASMGFGLFWAVYAIYGRRDIPEKEGL